MDFRASQSSTWQLIDQRRIQARNMQVRFNRSMVDSKLRQEQLKHWKPQPNYEAFKAIGGQIGRTLLFSWLFDECSTRNLRDSTAFLAVNYLDRILSRGCDSSASAQTIASICIRLAVKMDGVGGDYMHVPLFKDHPPPLHSELDVLHSLEWQMNVPTIHLFLTIFAELVWLPQCSRERTVEYAKHISLYVDSQQFCPSSLALACILLLERDSLLPSPCKALALGLVCEGKVNGTEIGGAVKKFRHVCFSSNCEHYDDDDDDDQRTGTDSSATTAYPGSSSTQTSTGSS